MAGNISSRIVEIEKVIVRLNRIEIGNVRFLASIIREEERSKEDAVTLIGQEAYRMAEKVADGIDSGRYRLRDSQKLKILKDCSLVMIYAELCKEGNREGWYRKVPMFGPMEV